MWYHLQGEVDHIILRADYDGFILSISLRTAQFVEENRHGMV